MTPRRHVVIVDDEPNIGLSLRLILEGEGYRVSICDSAARFRAMRTAGRADLYLLDVRLPDGNGIELLRSIRQNDDSTPAVMISGHGTIRDAVQATQNGAFDFLEKPIGLQKLLGTVAKALADKDVASKLSAQTLDPMHMTPEQFASFIKSETSRWTEVVKSSGAKAD